MVCARDLMQFDPISLLPQTPFLEVLRLFVVGQISGAPVVDDRATVLGLLSTNDLLRIVDQVCDDDIDPEPSREGSVRVESSESELRERLGVLTALDESDRGMSVRHLDPPHEVHAAPSTIARSPGRSR